MAGRIDLKVQAAASANRRPVGVPGRVVLSDKQGTVVVLPFAPTGFQASGWARKWADLERSTRKNVLVDTGPGLRRITFPITLGRADSTSISDVLRDLMQLADAAGVVTITGLSTLEYGPWRLEDVRVNVTHRTTTNEPRIAEVELDLAEFTEFKARIGRSRPNKRGRRR